MKNTSHSCARCVSAIHGQGSPLHQYDVSHKAASWGSSCPAVDVLDGGLWTWNVGAGEIELSPAWLRSIGYNPQEHKTRIEVCERRVHPADLPRVKDALDAHFKRLTDSYRSEHRIRTGQGEWIWIHDRGLVVARDEAGSPLVMSGAVFTIRGGPWTALPPRLRNDALLNAGRLESLGTLAAGVAHEFRNLLTAILCDVQLARGQKDQRVVRRSLERIERVAIQATQVARTLLNLSRGGTMSTNPIRILTVIEESVDTLSPLLPAHIHLTVRAKDAEDCWVNADATLLHQMMVNLILNARDAMPSGGTLEIDLTHNPPEANGPASHTAPDWECVVISVRDNGPGMPEQVRARVFEPFFTTKTDRMGGGLGLTVVQGIVNEHGGQMNVQSLAGRGTQVMIALPACRPV